METPLKAKLCANLSGNFKTPVTVFKQTAVTTLPASPFLQKLGYGTGVDVLRLKRKTADELGSETRSPWAIKILSKRVNREDAQIYGKRLTDEAAILKSLNHPNIVGFRGFDKLDNGKDYIAMEFCDISLGNLLEERNEKCEGSLEVDKISKMCLDILKGLNYLHTEAFILHGDLKSFNILVKNNFEVCKICDFGVSLRLKPDGKLDVGEKNDNFVVGTSLWAAPEIIFGTPDMVTSKSDIFSFGLIIYETIALVPPHTLAFHHSSKRKLSLSESSLGVPVNKIHKKLDINEVVVLSSDDEEENEKAAPKENASVEQKENENENKIKEPTSNETDVVEENTKSVGEKLKEVKEKDSVVVEQDEMKVDEAIEKEIATGKEKPEIEETNEEKTKDLKEIAEETVETNEQKLEERKENEIADETVETKIEENKKEINENELEKIVAAEEKINENAVTTKDKTINKDVSIITVEDDEDSIIDCDEYDTDNAEDYDDDYNEDTDEEDYEDEFEPMIGTRPPIPDNLPEEYNGVVEIFFVCTNEDLDARPDAKTLLKALDVEGEY